MGAACAAREDVGDAALPLNFPTENTQEMARGVLVEIVRDFLEFVEEDDERVP